MVAVIAALLVVGSSALFLLTRLAQTQPSLPSGPLLPLRLAGISICDRWGTATVAGGNDIVQNDEWGSSVPECVSTDGHADFEVTSSSINNTGGAPGGYPSIFMGCHWGACTPNQNGLPRRASTFAPRSSANPLTSVTTVQPGGSNVYDVAYDIWFNRSSSTTTQANAEELMVWLNQNGGVHPFGTEVAAATIDGIRYDIWAGRQTNPSGISWNTVSYEMQRPAASVSNLNIGDLALDSVRRDYMTSSDWLIDVEMGFELWVGGRGLGLVSYSVAPYGTTGAAQPDTR